MIAVWNRDDVLLCSAVRQGSGRFQPFNEQITKSLQQERDKYGGGGVGGYVHLDQQI